MTDHETPEEEILGRLRAADPAAGSPTDLARLRAAVDARIAAERDGEAAARAAGPTRHHADARGEAATVTPLTAARSRRTTGLRLAAAAAGVLVIAAAGFGLGRSTGDPAPTASPAITLGGPTGGGATAPGGPEVLSGPADAAIYPAPSVSRMSFHAVGLSDEPATATAWTYDPAASFSAERTAALGSELGVEGEPQLAGGAWQLGVTDGTGPYLIVSPDGTTSANYYDPAKDPHQCARTEPGAAAPDATDDSDSPGGADTPKGTAPPYEWCEKDADPAPDGEAAFGPVRALLEAAGHDPATFELVENDYGDPSITEVVAHQLVAGVRTGSAWYVTVTAAGVQSFSGMLAQLRELGDYPAISPVDAVDRLGDPRYGSFTDVRILSPAEGRVLEAPGQSADGASESAPDGASEPADVAAPDAPVTSGAADDPVSAPADPTGPPPAAAPGSPVPWPVEQVAITGARLGPALYTTPSGTALLVPAYELSADDGRTWSVVAVAEEALDLAG